MNQKDAHWSVDKELASKYSSPLDRQLYCDQPLFSVLGDFSGKKVLDIGCGNGFMARTIAQRAARVTAIDSSQEMLAQAKILNTDASNVEFLLAPAEKLPFPDASFDAAICSMTINTFSTEAMVEGMFRETARVLKTSGVLGISLPDPLTIGEKTKFRWTEWKPGQTQDNLKPGEAITRKFLNKNGELLTVTNYYWPPEVLIRLASMHHLSHRLTLEPKASQQDLEKYKEELDPALAVTPFFMVMAFENV